MSSPAPLEDPAVGREQVEPPPRRTLLRRATYWLERTRALQAWIEEARSRSRTLDATFETIERDSEVGGAMLAGALAYRIFVFVLPLAFFVVSGLGLLGKAIGVKPNVIANSAGFAGTVTKQVSTTANGSSSWWVAVSSFFVLVYATRVLLRSLAKVYALVWEGSAAAVKVSVHSLGMFALALVGLLGVTVGWGAVEHRTAIGGIVALLVVVLAFAALWLVVSLELPHAGARWTQLLPGSAFCGIGLVAVQAGNVLVLGRLMQEKSSTYGALGIAATLLLGFFFMGRVMVLSAVVNATLHRRRSRSA